MKGTMVLGAAALLAQIGICAAADAVPAPKPGVYGCYGQRGPTPAMTFGLLDATRYSDYDGKTGRYKYEPSTAVLTMTDGSMKNVRYKQVKPGVFRLLSDKGELTQYNCPFEKAKDPNKRPW